MSWKLEGHHPEDLFPALIKDGWTQQGEVVFNRELLRIEIFPKEGGWFGLYADGTWEYDAAPFCG